MLAAKGWVLGQNTTAACEVLSFFIEGLDLEVHVRNTTVSLQKALDIYSIQDNILDTEVYKDNQGSPSLLEIHEWATLPSGVRGTSYTVVRLCTHPVSAQFPAWRRAQRLGTSPTRFPWVISYIWNKRFSDFPFTWQCLCWLKVLSCIYIAEFLRVVSNSSSKVWTRDPETRSGSLWDHNCFLMLLRLTCPFHFHSSSVQWSFPEAA